MEVFHNRAWGTVCDDEWDMDDAQVLCRSMGYGDAQSATSGSSYGQGSGNIAFDDVQCSGDESSFFACASNGFQVHNCDHSKDAGASCSGKILNKATTMIIIVVMTIIHDMKLDDYGN